ncbi:MAG TPA: DNA mismatch repair protein MutS [Gemmatimonadaceae bacterium]|nr:DNA mismatch repair protein MutS [Gemmatimonadaceae bacterium]
MAQTPLMQQYRDIKSRHQDAIVFFRMGEFYEMFFEDAELGARVLGLTLTSRNNGGAADVPLAGVPVKAASDYIRRLVEQGHRVAICEQVEDPRQAKGVVQREVVETISPGAALADELLQGGRNNFVCAVHRQATAAGVAAADISTGELRLIVARPAELEPVLARLAPREILLARGSGDACTPVVRGAENALVTEREPWEFDEAMARDDLAAQFGVLSLDGLGVEAEDGSAMSAAGALLRYLRELQPGGVRLAHPVIERPGGVMPLDEMTRRNLELVESLRGGDSEGTLASVLDQTKTPMGARLLRHWILAPLTDLAAINARLDAVEALTKDALARAALIVALDGVRDVERLATRTALGRATPRDVRALGTSLGRLPAVYEAVQRVGHAGALSVVLTGWDSCADLAELVVHELVERPPLSIGEEPTIAAGVDGELDELRALRDGGKEAIARIQTEERARTGISSLKVGYNRVFGYFIEVTRSNLHLVPPDYQRRQTLTNGERFVTPALKEYEEKVLSAAERIEARERTLFEDLRTRVGAEITRLQHAARTVAVLDVLAGLAEVAVRENYVRPGIHAGFSLEISAGRHPVVERMMPRDKFIPNDIALSEDARMIILTGPNMAGKSTILRQVGLIVLMAQIGSFVPAAHAEIGVADRVFTRVGASDNLVRGQSTFMVEMAEASAILHGATTRSLVLLDEIGRGTSTYDGVSIAWAVSEHLHNAVGCKTVFATHYHELTQLEDELVSVRNYNVAVREVGEQVLFLHRMQPGGADRSYGIEVGRLAGLPAEVIARARQVLALLEGEQLVPALKHARSGATRANGNPDREAGAGAGDAARPSRGSPAQDAAETLGQLALFAGADHPVVQRLREVDINTLTPLEALTLLNELVRTVQPTR